MGAESVQLHVQISQGHVGKLEPFRGQGRELNMGSPRDARKYERREHGKRWEGNTTRRVMRPDVILHMWPRLGRRLGAAECRDKRADGRNWSGA